jgi:hypothetical protein
MSVTDDERQVVTVDVASQPSTIINRRKSEAQWLPLFRHSQL